MKCENCEEDVEHHMCEKCHSALIEEINVLSKRTDALIKDQEARDKRMAEMKKRTQESIDEVRDAQRKLRDRERTSEKSDTEIVHLVEALKDRDREIDQLKRQPQNRPTQKDEKLVETLHTRDREIDQLKRQIDHLKRQPQNLPVQKDEKLVETLHTRDREIEELKEQVDVKKNIEDFAIQLKEDLISQMRDTIRKELNSQTIDPFCQQSGPSLLDQLRSETSRRFTGTDPNFFFNMMQNDRENGGKIQIIEEGEKKLTSEDALSIIDVDGGDGESDISNLEKKQEDEEPSKTSQRDEGPISLTNYKKGLLLKGATEPFSEELKKLHGKWNSKLEGWVFSNKRKEAVEAFIESSIPPKVVKEEEEDPKKGKREKKDKKGTKFNFNEEMGVYLNSSRIGRSISPCEILFNVEKEAFAYMDDSEDYVSLDSSQIVLLGKKGYTVMARKERKKYLKEYLESAKSPKLAKHPKLKGYLFLKEKTFLFTSSEEAFCRIEDGGKSCLYSECFSLSKENMSWLEEHDFEILSKKDRRREIVKVNELLDELDSDSESDVDSDSESEVNTSDSDSDSD